MDLKEILFFGALIDSDYGEYGTTQDDQKLLHKALLNAYGLTENPTEEELSNADDKIVAYLQDTVKELRGKIIEYVNYNFIQNKYKERID